jgi:hypothetical protein
MRLAIVVAAALCATSAFAQNPPTVGDKPLVQVKPRTASAGPRSASSKSLSLAEKLLACLQIEDGSKGRLDCYDAAVPPQPKAKTAVAKGVKECRFHKEEDERLTCFNGFAESIPKFSAR